MKTFRVVETPFINYIVDVRDSSRSLNAYIRGCSLHEEKYANDTARERVLNAARASSARFTFCIRNPRPSAGLIPGYEHGRPVE